MKRGKPSHVFARYQFFAWFLAGVWTICVAGSLLWNLHQWSGRSGGLSVSTSTASLRATETPLGTHLTLAHVGLWLVGLAGIGTGVLWATACIAASMQARATCRCRAQERACRPIPSRT